VAVPTVPLAAVQGAKGPYLSIGRRGGTDMSIEAMKQALEALLSAEAEMNCEYGATELLRQAIEQAERFDKQPTKILSTEEVLNSAGFYKAEKREWVGLTEDEYKNIRYGQDECGDDYVGYELFDEGEYGFEVNIYVDRFAKAIEAKLKEKNT
jgi:hypothetical protein